MQQQVSSVLNMQNKMMLADTQLEEKMQQFHKHFEERLSDLIDSQFKIKLEFNKQINGISLSQDLLKNKMNEHNDNLELFGAELRENEVMVAKSKFKMD